MRIEYDPSLPITEKVDELKKTILSSQVLIVAGDTGSGKSTQLPKICLDLGLAKKGKIAHTQPRRLAATSIAKRLCEECACELGAEIGYNIRFSERLSTQTQLVLMTDGMLLAHIEKDRNLSAYDVIIIDEAHERSLNIDFILGFCKQIIQKRPELKVIITSATIDVDRFSAYFNGAPVINVGGKMYSVALEYQPCEQLPQGVYDALVRLGERNRIDTLVFLPTERDIHEVSHFLQKQNLFNTEVLPLFSRLDDTKQQKIFKKSAARKVILSTNIAETSLTVPGIAAVIDSGLVRIKRYSSRSKVERLPIEPISKASAKQRAGRAGRLGPGVCIRLYDEDDFNLRPEFTDPEIKRSNLASVILKMKIARLGDIRQFDFIESVDSTFINDGFRLLHELGALDEHHHLTPIGRLIAQFPVEPRLARAIVAAKDLKVLDEILLIIAGLAVPDCRLRPMDRQTKADELHAKYNHPKSDFMGFLKLYQMVQSNISELSNRKKRDYFEKNLLSIRRWQEWRDVYRQLKQICQQLKWAFKHFNLEQDWEKVEKKSDAITRAFLPGLLSHIGLLEDEKHYRGARSVGFNIFPGSALKKQTPKWVVGYELLEIKKVYLRVVCPLNAAWIEPVAKHLIKTHVFEPFWSPSGYVMAFEKVTLYGLEVVAKRKINYRHDIKLARQIFIENALVLSDVKVPLDFMVHNIAMIEALEALEHQSRTMGIIATEKAQYEYFDTLLPEGIYDLTRFTKWYKNAPAKTKNAFFLSREFLLVKPDVVSFPEKIQMGANRFELSYHFERGAIDDGVSLIIPIEKLGSVDSTIASYLVGPMLNERIQAMIKSLPKSLRKQCLPAKDYAEAVFNCIDLDQIDSPLKVQLAKHLSRMTGASITHMDFDEQAIEPHLTMNFKLFEGDVCVMQTRDYNELVGEYKEESVSHTAQQFAFFEQKELTRWNFGDLPETVNQRMNGETVVAYPAIIDEGKSVTVTARTSLEESLNESAQGVLRLFRLTCQREEKQIKRDITAFQKIKLLGVNFDFDCVDSLIKAVFSEVFNVYEVPFKQADFESRLSKRGQLFKIANERAQLVLNILESASGLMPWLARTDCKGAQSGYDYLLFDGFIETVSQQWLRRYPVYLKALKIRLEKAKADPGRDRDLYAQIEPLWVRFLQDETISLLDDVHFLLEELKISLFAQHLKTCTPVSVKKIQKAFEGL